MSGNKIKTKSVLLYSVLHVSEASAFEVASGSDDINSPGSNLFYQLNPQVQDPLDNFIEAPETNKLNDFDTVIVIYLDNSYLTPEEHSLFTFYVTSFSNGNDGFLQQFH